MFAAVAPTMIHEGSEATVKNAISRFFVAEGRASLADDEDLKEKELADFEFDPEYLETVLIQFRALGLIEQSIRSRSLRDSRTYWRLTKHGDALMTKLRAIRRGEEEDEEDEVETEVVAEPEQRTEVEPDVEEI